MSVEIRQSIVTPAIDGSVVQLHISDAPPDDASASLRLILTVKLPSYEMPLLTQLQREVMSRVQAELTGLLQRGAQDIREGGFDLNPRPAPRPVNG